MYLIKFFWTLSGDDKFIIEQCDSKVQNRFTLIGVFVFLIFLICFISSFIAFDKFFNSKYLGIPLAMFFAWMITNIYLLVLYTLSKNSFPVISDYKYSKAISLLVRIGFIAFMSVMISKPIETIIFSNKLELNIQEFKRKQIIEYEKLTNEYYDEEVATIELILKNSKSNNADYEKIIKRSKIERDESISSMKKIVDNSNYYTKSIIMMNMKYPECWFITLIMIIIFLYPISQKRFIGENKEYEEFNSQKSKLEIELVTDSYHWFKHQYSKIFRKKFSKEFQFTESYIDPPFNTVKKEKLSIDFLDESKFIIDLYA